MAAAALLTLSPSFSPPSTCTDAVVGGGWSGVYFLYRRALASADPSSLCLFESSHRIGGRTYSVGPSVLNNEFTVDIGAYRFSPDMHLPGDLILHDLKLPVACYEPSCPDAAKDFPPPFMFNYSAPLVRIVDPTTKLPAGYVSALHAMLSRLEPLGVRVFLNATVVDVSTAGSSTKLTFAGGGVTTATTVLLNLPRNKLLALPSLVRSVAPRTLGMLQCVKFDAPPSMFHNMTIGQSTGLTKAYLYYGDAWWVTKLNKTEGQYPHNAFLPLTAANGLKIGTHFNDGPVACADDGANGQTCHGYLQIYYAATNETFYYGTSGAPAEPLGIAHAQPPYEHARLEKAHAAIIDVLAPLLAAAGVDPASLPYPTQMVVGAWSRPGVIKHDHGYTSPTKVYWDPSISGTLGAACAVDGLTEDEYRSTVLQPFGKEAAVYLANNDFLAQQSTYFEGDWAQESLLQCERALYRLGVKRPDWLNASYYAERIVAKAW